MKKKRILIIVLAILSIIVFGVFFFIIPTTTYYKVIITPDSMKSRFGDYTPNVHVYETYGTGDWEECLERHRIQGQYKKERQERQYYEHMQHSSSSAEDYGRGLALKDIANSRAILVSIKHTRNFDAEKILNKIRDLDDIKNLEHIYKLEVKVGYIY